jgi:DNA-binding MarR family transcriptional regulator
MSDERDESLSEVFWDVARRLRHASRESLAEWDIAPSHARALGVLIRDGALRLSDLSDRLHIAPRSTTEVVDGLQERGLVERRADQDDRRATIVAVTAAGQRVGAAVQANRAATGDRVFSALSATDRAHLARILGKLRTTDG